VNEEHRANGLVDAGIWKGWALMCLTAASRLGVAPLTSVQLHVLLYLANTLAPLFDVERVRGRVLKRGSLPFFPDVQPEIDRLAYAGVLEIVKVDFGAKERLVAHYDVTQRAREIRQAFVDSSEEAKRTDALFRELVSASFGRFLGRNAAMGSVDANYSSNAVLENEVVDFSEWSDENRNMQVARYLIEKLQALRPNGGRDGVRLYCGYIEKALALA
jgi:hypothetical protein